MKKLILILFYLFLITNLVQAEDSKKDSYLGTFAQNECVNLYQLCDDCTYVNISSVTYPNSTILSLNKIMTKNNVDFNYSFCNTNTLGEYSYKVCGDKEGTFECEKMDFKITPNGEELSTGKGFVQLGLLFLIIIFLIISLIGVFKVEDYKGKFALYWASHLLMIATMFISWQMAQDFLTGVSAIAGMFKIAFYFFIISAFPMIFLSLAWIFWIHTMTDEVKSMMDRGMKSEEAWDRASSNKKGWFGI